jgi:hypothetical protein
MKRKRRFEGNVPSDPRFSLSLRPCGPPPSSEGGFGAQSAKLKFELLTKSAGMGYNTIYIGENGQSVCVSTLAVFTYDSGGSCYVSKLQG